MLKAFDELLFTTIKDTPNIRLNKLINKYKNRIPIIYTGEVLFIKNEISHSHPKIVLNYRWEKAPDPDATLIMLYVHEQLHWYEAPKLSDNILKKLHIENKELLNNKLTIYEFPNERNLLIHVIVLTNELLIANDILTDKEYNSVYHSSYWQPYTNTRMYIENHLNQYISSLSSLHLIWSKKEDHSL